MGLTTLLVVLASACTYNHEEPGLFPPRDPSIDSTRETERPPATNPALPVAGESAWTTADGAHVTVRIAVHAVRRTDAATLLDWSVTPLSAPGLRPGERIPGPVDLGLATAADSNVGIVLLDPTGPTVYRPLTHSSARVFHHCLCTPVWLAQQTLRIGETALMQVAYPPLPAGLNAVDVGFATVAPVYGVPVTPVGQVPTALGPTDLTRPAEPAHSATDEVRFGANRGQALRINRIVAGPGSTAVEWTLRSIRAQPRNQVDGYGPPVTRAPARGADLVNQSPTDGLVLRAGATELNGSWMTARVNGRPGLECLCTELGLWASNRWVEGGNVRVVTLYPALPTGTTRVEVLVPGVYELRDVAVERPPAAASRLGPPVAAPAGALWRYDQQPPPAWTTAQWPTPGPAVDQQGDYDLAVERVRPLPPA